MMETCRIGILMLLMSAAMVTGLSRLPGTDPPRDKVSPPHLPIWPPYPITVKPPPWLEPFPPRVCPCVVICCEHTLKKRSTMSTSALNFLANSPHIRHKRCCGCNPFCKLRRLS